MMGVNVTYMRFLTFGISAALACIAGVMIAPLTYARVDMSATIGMESFAAAILGGIGKPVGCLAGRHHPGHRRSRWLGLHLHCLP